MQIAFVRNGLSSMREIVSVGPEQSCRYSLARNFRMLPETHPGNSYYCGKQ